MCMILIGYLLKIRRNIANERRRQPTVRKLFRTKVVLARVHMPWVGRMDMVPVG